MEPTLAEIRLFAGNFAPRGWALCHGQLLPISQYSALFSLLGTTYGGDGRTTFALPDLRSRVPIGNGRGPGLTDRRLGSKSGTETNTLNVTQIPSHKHSSSGSVKVKNGAGDDPSPGGKFLASTPGKLYANASNIDMAKDSVSVTLGNTGGNQPVNNTEPYLSLNYIIALNGLYPSRS